MRVRIEHALHVAWRKKGLFSLLMWPLSQVYGAIIARRKSSFEKRPERIHHETLPVVVVGNIYVGGTGKTPVVMALVDALQARGWHPGVISRGYGARPGKTPRAGQGELDPALFGDEPALIAARTQAPVCVHPDRKAALRRLRRQYPKIDVVVADDGLQHLTLGRDVEIAVQDARGIGNGRLIPAGPLREPASRLETVDFIVNNLQPGETPHTSTAGLAHTVDMILEPTRVEHLQSGEEWNWGDWLTGHKQKTCAAVAAIGRPERFFDMLRTSGLALEFVRALPDHHSYDHSPFSDLDVDCILITPKDAVKCRKFNDPRLYCVHPGPRFSDPAWLDLVHELLQAIATRKLTSARAEALHSEF